MWFLVCQALSAKSLLKILTACSFMAAQLLGLKQLIFTTIFLLNSLALGVLLCLLRQLMISVLVNFTCYKITEELLQPLLPVITD